MLHSVGGVRAVITVRHGEEEWAPAVVHVSDQFLSPFFTVPSAAFPDNTSRVPAFMLVFPHTHGASCRVVVRAAPRKQKENPQGGPNRQEDRRGMEAVKTQ